MSSKRTYAVVLEPEEEGGFTVRVPAFPEIVTYGKDETDALAMAEDAIRLVIEDSLARGESLRVSGVDLVEIGRCRADPNRRLVSHEETRARIKRLGA